MTVRRLSIAGSILAGAILLVAILSFSVLQNGERSGLSYYDPLNRIAGSSDRRKPPAILDRIVGELPAESLSTYDWARELQSQGFRVCVEDVRHRPSDRSPEYRLSGNHKLREVLDELVANDSRFRWDGLGSGIINIVPKFGSFLAYEIDATHFSRQKLSDCFNNPVILEKAKLSLVIKGGVDHPGHIANWTFQMNRDNLDVRDFLNLLVSKYDSMAWSINGLGMVGIDVSDDVREKVSKELAVKSKGQPRKKSFDP